LTGRRLCGNIVRLEQAALQFDEEHRAKEAHHSPGLQIIISEQGEDLDHGAIGSSHDDQESGGGSRRAPFPGQSGGLEQNTRIRRKGG